MKDVYLVDKCNCHKCVEKRLKKAYKHFKFPILMGNRLIGQHWVLNHIEKLEYCDKYDEYEPCSCCGTVVMANELYEVKPGYKFCQSCRRTYDWCSECGGLHAIGRLREYNDRRICNRCAVALNIVICNDCGRAFDMANIASYLMGKVRNQEQYIHLCNRCAKVPNRIRHCKECKKAFPIEVLNVNCHCAECAELQRCYFNDYRFKPTRFYFHKLSNENPTLFFGSEIEAAYFGRHDIEEVNDHVLNTLRDKYGKTMMYGMYDGTIRKATGNYGMEIVIHPWSWNFYKTNGVDILNDVVYLLRKHNYVADKKGLGYHIHTTKAAWGTYQLYKLFELVYNNKVWFELASGREENDYCKFNDRHYIRVAKNKTNTNRDHYSAINLNYSNGQASNTVEFRMFAGSLEPLILHKNFELVYSLYEYTNKYRDMDMSTYFQFIKNNKPSFKCLNEFVNVKGLI